MYAAPTRVQFMNHADDRIRGMSANPFTPSQQALVILANGTEKKNGPFPGDDVLYSFALYPNSKLSKSNGSALFTCYFTFIKRATCEAYFQLKTGLVLASGQVRFNSTRFTLSVVGGTNAYLASHRVTWWRRPALEGKAGPAPRLRTARIMRADFAHRAGTLAGCEAKLALGLHGRGARRDCRRVRRRRARRVRLRRRPEHSMTIYSVATNVQYLNNADDEARGSTNNPFDPATNKLKPKLNGRATARSPVISPCSASSSMTAQAQEDAGNGVVHLLLQLRPAGSLRRRFVVTKWRQRHDRRLRSRQLRRHAVHVGGDRRHGEIPWCARRAVRNSGCEEERAATCHPLRRRVGVLARARDRPDGGGVCLARGDRAPVSGSQRRRRRAAAERPEGAVDERWSS